MCSHVCFDAKQPLKKNFLLFNMFDAIEKYKLKVFLVKENLSYVWK
jgi:hypothetical protein